MTAAAAEALRTAGSPETRFEADMSALCLAPLWTVMGKLVTSRPESPALAAHWPYDAIRPVIEAAGTMVSAEQAERRVLILENPGMPGQSAATRSLYAGLQLVLPGEVAPAHRHTQSALRFVIEGAGGFTTVDGERLDMAPGDLVLTPAWTWHDHGNAGNGPMIWLDGLDVQIVNLFDTSFSESAVRAQQDVERSGGFTAGTFGHALAPLEQGAVPSPNPLRHYPYAHMREALAAVVAKNADPVHGARLRYTNPATGGWALPTMGPFAQIIPAGTATSPCRSTDGTVMLVAEGRGRAMIGASGFELARGDVFVIPAWEPRWFAAETDLVLQGFSDRPAQEAMGLFREDRKVADLMGQTT